MIKINKMQCFSPVNLVVREYGFIFKIQKSAMFRLSHNTCQLLISSSKIRFKFNMRMWQYLQKLGIFCPESTAKAFRLFPEMK